MPTRTSVLVPGEPFSLAELRAACLDGELVPLAAGFIPPDAPTPPRVRAAALAPLSARHHAFVRLTAAWVHGAADEPEMPVHLQRCVAWRPTRPVDHRMVVHSHRMADADVVSLAGVRVSSPVRTLADLARIASSPQPGASQAAVRSLAADPVVREEAIVWFARNPSFAHARGAVALLRSLRQEEVTR